MRRRPALSLMLVVICTSPSIAQTDTRSVLIPIESGNPIAALGVGYRFTPLPGTTCAEPRGGISPDTLSHNESGSLKHITRASEAREDLELSAEVSGGYGPFSASGSHHSYRERLTTSAFNQIRVRTRVHVRGERIVDARLTQQAATLLENDVNAFRSSCGYAYVAGIDYGGEFIGEVTATYSSAAEQSEASTAINAALSGVGSAAVRFNRARDAMGTRSMQRAQYFILGNVRAPSKMDSGGFAQFAAQFGGLVQNSASAYRAHTAPYVPAMVDLCSDQARCRANLAQLQSGRARVDAIVLLREEAVEHLRSYRNIVSASGRYPPVDESTLRSQTAEMERVLRELSARLECEFAKNCAAGDTIIPAPVPPPYLSWKRTDVQGAPTCLAGFDAGVERALLIRGRYANSAADVRNGIWRQAGHSSIRVILRQPDSNRGSQASPLTISGAVGQVCVGVQSPGANNHPHPTDQLMMAVYDPARPLFPTRAQLNSIAIN